MSDQSNIRLPDIQEANQSYASTDRPGLGPRPVKQLCILTCMDARLDLFPALGLGPGDAHFLRNAGGRASADAIRSLLLSSHHLGTREFAVIHHTKCGLQTSNQAIWDTINSHGGGDASHIDFLPFDDLDASVRQDVDEIVNCGLLPRDAIVWGATFDVDEGTLNIVVPPRPLG